MAFFLVCNEIVCGHLAVPNAYIVIKICVIVSWHTTTLYCTLASVLIWKMLDDLAVVQVNIHQLKLSELDINHEIFCFCYSKSVTTIVVWTFCPKDLRPFYFHATTFSCIELWQSQMDWSWHHFPCSMENQQFIYYLLL